jgi:hypothetical protein
VSGPDAADAGQYRVPAGLLEKLMAAVRPEFRADEMTFDPRDPVFGGKPCLVSSCERPACGHGLCHGHRQRWAAAGGPGVREFTESTASPWRKNAPLSRCRARECRYGVGHRKGLCVRHSDAWEKAGTPALADWLDTLPGTAPAAPLADCLIGSCGLWAEPGSDDAGHTARPGNGTAGRPQGSSPRNGRKTNRLQDASGSGWRRCPHNSSWKCSTHCSAGATSVRARPRPTS